ncbi:MAG TPA: hypothetical protein VF520_04645 [Thermoleophilaceae bacterium]|jgi:hypothetical protein
MRGILTTFVVATAIALAGAAGAQAQVELFVADRADGLTVSGNAVFWKSDCGGEFDPSRSRLKSIPADGGTIRTHYFPSTCRPDRVSGVQVAVDSTHVYYLTGDRRVVRKGRTAAESASPDELSTTAGPVSSSCCDVAVDGSNVYWSERTDIYFAPKTGGARQLLDHPAGSGEVYDMRAAGGGSLLYLFQGSLRRIRADRATDVVASDVSAYAFDGSRIYFVRTPASGDKEIRSVRSSDLGDPQLHATVPRAYTVSSLAVDSTGLYWHEQRNVTGGPVVRQRFGAGQPKTDISPFVLFYPGLHSNGRYLFWADNEGVHRLQVNAPQVPPPGDVRVTGMEVTQSIQTTSNDIPLVGGKATVVRVYVAGQPDSRGDWTGVTGRLTATGSSRIHVPANRYTITAPATGSDRATMDDSFTFVLDPAATTPGEHTLRVQLHPPAGRPEGNTANNSLSMRVRFGQRRDFTMRGFTYGNTDPDLAEPPFADFEEHRAYTENILPFSSLTITRLPGDPRRTFSNLADDTYNAGEAYLKAHNWLNDEMSRLYPSGGETAYLLTPESAGYFGWCCSSPSGNQVLRGQNFRGDPGPTMAHELAHRFGRCHTPNVGNNGCQDFNFPRADGTFGSQVGVRLNPLSALPGQDANGNSLMGDTMSYTFPQWISPYTYCGLLTGATCPASVTTLRRGATSFQRLTSAAARPPGLVDGDRRFLYVSGIVRRQEGRVQLDAMHVVGSAKDIATKTDGKTFEVALEDASGNVLSRWATDGSDRFYTEGTPEPFSAYLPFADGTARVVVRSGEKVLAERKVSATAPTVTLKSPAPGATLKGRRKVTWDGADADGDALTYAVEYSSDGGRSWVPLQVGLAGESATVDFGRVPGSKRALLRVSASDGVLTATDEIDRRVTVPAGGPEVEIASLGRKAKLRKGQPVLLRGDAFDDEDGAIVSGKAYTWRSNRVRRALGTGRWIAASLPAGTQRITLTVRDRSGRVGRATRTVVVSKRAWAGKG